jgi:hypothetical protein
MTRMETRATNRLAKWGAQRLPGSGGVFLCVRPAL